MLGTVLIDRLEGRYRHSSMGYQKMRQNEARLLKGLGLDYKVMIDYYELTLYI